MPAPESPTSHGSSRSQRFLTSVIWNWMGVLANLFAGFFLSPVLIRKLGPEGYGIWAFSASIVEYFWLFDLGFRSATLKFVAHYWATGEKERISEVVSTGFLYAASAATFIVTGVVVAFPYIQGFFKISEAYRSSFHVLVLLTTVSWCGGMVFSIFSASLEGIQRYDLTNHAGIVYVIVRSTAWTALLFTGYGLIPISVASLLAQCVLFGINYYNFRRTFPFARVSYARAGIARLKEMASFGIHTFVQTVSTQGITQSPAVVIGHFLPVEFFGFFNVPIRLLQYTVDFVGRIGLVTNSNAAELAARREVKPLAALAIFTNRYCLVIFMPMAILLGVHGAQFLSLWAGAQVASRSAPLLPILLSAYLMAFVGQFSSGMMLQGLGRHQNYARSLAVEGVVVFAALWLVVPRWGILGAAYVTGAAMVLNRGFFTSWLVSREVGIRLLSYLGAVYARPLLAAAPVLGIAWLLRATMLPGTAWLHVAAMGAIVGVLYYALSLAVCLEGSHRSFLASWLLQRWRYLSAE